MWISCRFRKKKSTMEEKIQKIKEELEAKYEKELAERKEECEELKEKVKRLKRHIRKMKKAYEDQMIYTANDEIWNDSILETMNNVSELQTDMSYKFCALSPVSTETQSIEILDEETNFCREAAVGILYNIPMIRDAVLNHIEADQRKVPLQILYDVFSQMGRPPHLPNSEILQKLPVHDSLLEYILMFLSHILYKVPHMPTKAFKNLNKSDKKEALRSLRTSRIFLVKNIMFEVRSSALYCKCENANNIVIEYFAFDFDKTSFEYDLYFAVLALAEKEQFSCSKCGANCDGLFMEDYQPDYGHYFGETLPRFANVSVFRNDYSFAAAVFEKKTTGEFCYVIRKKRAYWLITRKGIKLLENYSKVVDLFQDPSVSLVIVQYKKEAWTLDDDVLNFIQKLEDPPARFTNTWGDCAPITVSNVLLCLPKRLRRRLKELEVPKGERPSPRCIALLWELIDGSEKVVAKQKKDDWKTPAPYPEHITSLLMKLGLKDASCANKDGRGRMVDAGGTSTEEIFNSLFERHAQSDAFKAFASYNVIKKGEKLEEHCLDAKKLNIFVFEGILTLGEVILLWPKNSVLLVFVHEKRHGYLMIIRPNGDVIDVDGSSLSYFEKIYDFKKTKEVGAFICIPDQTET